MSDYTLVNLHEVDDAAGTFGQEANGAIRPAREALNAEQVGVMVHQLKPGKRQGFGHRHERAEEIFVVLSGSGRVMINDQLVELRERDAVRIAAAASRRFEAGPEGLDLLAVGQHFENDGEFQPDFWAE